MSFLLDGVMAVTWQQLIMYGVGICLIWLAVKKGYEPSLLLPLGFGAILVNLPYSGVIDQMVQGKVPAAGIIEWLFKTGIEASEAMPILLFIGIGAMIDFGPLLSQPVLFLFGAAAQFGIFAAILIACMMGFDLKDAASSALQMDLLPFWCRRCWAPATWVPLQWRLTRTWRWCPLSSPLPSVL